MKLLYVCALFLASLTAFAQDYKPAPMHWNALRAATLHLDTGTGFLVKAKSGRTYMLTNWHVCISSARHNQIKGSLPYGTSFIGDILESDPLVDLCIIKIDSDRDGLDIAPMFDSKGALYSRGYPSHILSETTGVFSHEESISFPFELEMVGETCPKPWKTLFMGPTAVGCMAEYTNYVTSLFAMPGASGSPVVNGRGELVGVVQTTDMSNPKGNAGLVPYPKVKKFLERY